MEETGSYLDGRPFKEGRSNRNKKQNVRFVFTFTEGEAQLRLIMNLRVYGQKSQVRVGGRKKKKRNQTLKCKTQYATLIRVQTKTHMFPHSTWS